LWAENTIHIMAHAAAAEQPALVDIELVREMLRAHPLRTVTRFRCGAVTP